MLKSRHNAVASSEISDCRRCPIARTAEWKSLSSQELERLNAARIVFNFRPGQVIYRHGDLCRGIYCISSGTVALRKVNVQGRSVVVRLAHRGETLGYSDYFGQGEYSVNAEALEASQLCFLERKAVHHLLEQNPNLGLGFLAHLARDLKMVEESILQNRSYPVRVRLAHLLLALKDRYASEQHNGSCTLSLPMTRQDLAAVLGTRPETIARTVNAMRGDSVAFFSGRTVRIPSLKTLIHELEPTAP
jgi:CRP/FNR family transcriptional regulator